MHIALQSVSEILGVNDFMFRLAFEGIDEDLARRQLRSDTNSLLWLLGHIAVNRAYISTLCGHELTSPWDDQFNKSIEKVDHAAFPKFVEIQKFWDQIASVTSADLDAMDEAKLMAPAPFKFPTREQTVLAGISFMAMHESYHVGQLSSLRKHLGIDSLFELAVREMKKRREDEAPK